MDSSETPQGQAPDPSSSGIIWSVVPTWIALFVELLGGWRFSKDSYSEQYAIPLGAFYPLTSAIFAVVIVSPLFIMQGFFTLISKRKSFETRKQWFRFLVILLTVSFLASMFSCVWSCG